MSVFKYMLRYVQKPNQEERKDPEEGADGRGQRFWPGTVMPDGEEDSNTPVNADGRKKKHTTDIHNVEEREKNVPRNLRGYKICNGINAIYRHTKKESKVGSG